MEIEIGGVFCNLSKNLRSGIISFKASATDQEGAINFNGIKMNDCEVNQMECVAKSIATRVMNDDIDKSKEKIIQDYVDMAQSKLRMRKSL